MSIQQDLPGDLPAAGLRREGFRAYADRCAAIAARAAPADADALAAMARVWRALADEDDRIADLVRDADAGFAAGPPSPGNDSAAAFWEKRPRVQPR